MINRSTSVVDPQPNRLLSDEQQFRTNNFCSGSYNITANYAHLLCKYLLKH